jgi:hypothetical protein
MVLLQCVTQTSFAAKGHTTNNGGNLAEIRVTDAWRNFEAVMAPCLTPNNLCGLEPRALEALKAALAAKAGRPLVLPAEEVLYQAAGVPKSEAEMHEIILSSLQSCGPALTGISAREIAGRALAISPFAQVRLGGGPVWSVFQREGIFVEDAARVQDLTPKFRALLRLPEGAKLRFERLYAREIGGGLIEIGGRVGYVKEVERNDRFTILAQPEGGALPQRYELVVFR